MKGNFTAIEVGIFAIVSLVFLNSAYHLFTEGTPFGGDSTRKVLIAAKEPQATPTKTQDETSAFVPYETKCQPSGETFETSASKIRILGPFCGSAPEKPVRGVAASPEQPTEYRIENATTHYVATVFNDQEQGKFSTDFIPLAPGANKVILEFKYKSGKLFPVELTINRK